MYTFFFFFYPNVYTASLGALDLLFFLLYHNFVNYFTLEMYENIWLNYK